MYIVTTQGHRKYLATIFEDAIEAVKVLAHLEEVDDRYLPDGTKCYVTEHKCVEVSVQSIDRLYSPKVFDAMKAELLADKKSAEEES